MNAWAENFHLLTYQSDRGPRTGLLRSGAVLDIGDALGHQCSGSERMIDLLRQWDTALPLLTALASDLRPASSQPVDRLTILAPLPEPNVYFCAGANYYDHVLEMSPGQQIVKEEKQPFFFLKPGIHATIGPADPIHLPLFSNAVDWEIELGAVIGRGGRNVSPEDALQCVAGYTILNDLSARDHTVRDDWVFKYDWLSQKAFEGSMVMGPWITPAPIFGDPQEIELRLWRNSELMQDSTTANMIFSVAELIAYLSTRVTLRAGDVIATGTPAGVGRPRNLFLAEGDTVRVEIAGIGSMENAVKRARS